MILAHKTSSILDHKLLFVSLI